MTLLVAADVYRPAAIDQLITLGERVGCDVYSEGTGSGSGDANPVKLCRNAMKKAIEEGGSSIRDFNNTDGQEGNFQQFFNVYGRKGEICRRLKCEGKIKIIRISKRSTFYCDKCQK